MKSILCVVLALVISPVASAAGVCSSPVIVSGKVVSCNTVVQKNLGHSNVQRVVNHSQVKQVVNNNHSKNNVVESYDVVQKVVEFDADYFLGTDGYYDVGIELQAQRESRDSEIIADQLRRQSEQINRLIGLLSEQVNNSTVLPAPQPLPPAPTVPVAPQEPEVPQVNTADLLNKEVFRIFKESCYQCHGPNAPKAGFSLIVEKNGQEGLRDLSLQERVSVYDLTVGIGLRDRGKRLMPIGGPPLSDQEVETLRLWMVAKAE